MCACAINVVSFDSENICALIDVLLEKLNHGVEAVAVRAVCVHANDRELWLCMGATSWIQGNYLGTGSTIPVKAAPVYIKGN